MKSNQQTEQKARSHGVFGVIVVALAGVVVLASAAACAPEEECIGRQCKRGANDQDSNGNADASAPACTVFGKPHVGLGGVDLAAKNNRPAYTDRARAKPYSALTTEFARVLGSQNGPSSIADFRGTFGDPPARWYVEPYASAVFVNTAYNLAFEGCLKLTGEIAGGSADARFATAPTAEAAKPVCSDWLRKFTSRDAAPDQVDACVAVALESTSETYGGGSQPEETRPTTPKRQWAYACASVLAGTGFLMY